MVLRTESILQERIAELEKEVENLKNTKGLFQSLVVNIPGITYRCLFDKHWTMLYLSDKIYDISGYKSDDFINNKIRTYDSIIHQDDTILVYQAVREAIKNNKPWDIEYRIFNKNGSIRWVHERGVGILNKKGKVEYLDGVIIDETERKEIEHELKVSEERYNLAVKGSKVGIWDWDDISTDNYWWSPRIYEMLGYRAGEITPTISLWKTLMHPDDVEKTTNILQKHFNDGTPYNVEFRMKKKTGDYIWVAAIGESIENSEAMSVRMSGSITDITDRKIIQEQLANSERKHRYLIENLQDLILILDKDGFVLWNSPAVRDFNVETSQVTGANFMDFVHPDDKYRIEKVIDDAVHNPNEIFKINGLKGVTPDGNIFYLDDTFQYLPDTPGIHGIVVIVHNVTSQKKYEQELIESQELYRDITNAQTAGIYRIRTLSGLQKDEDNWSGHKDVPYIFEFANDHFCSLFDVKREYLFNNPEVILEFILTEDREGFIKNNAEANSKFIPFMWEGRVLVNNKIIWLHFESLPRKQETGDTLWTGICYDITERKQAAINLRKEKELSEAALNAQSDTFFLFDPNTGKALRWNQSFVEISGYTDEEIAKMPAPESYYSKEDLKKATEFVKKVITNESSSIELELICKDGRKILTEYNVSVLKDHNGKPQYLISVGRDITERKHTELKLKEHYEKINDLNNDLKLINKQLIRAKEKAEASEKKFREIIENANITIYSLNLKTGTYGYLSPSVKKMYGYSPEEFIKGGLESSINNIHPDDVEKLQNHVEKLLESKVEYFSPTVEYRFNHPQLGYRWMSDTRAVIKNKDKEPISLIGFVIDITDKKETEQKLIEANKLFEGAINQSPVPMVVALSNGELKIFNEAVNTQLGIKEADGIKPGIQLSEMNQTWKDYESNGNFIPTEELPLAMALKGKSVKNQKIRVVRSDGTERWELASGAPIYDDDGNVIAGIVSFPDITELITIEAQLKASEERFGLAQSAATIGSWDWNIVTGQLNWSNQIEPMFGLKQGEFGETFEDFLNYVHIDDRQYVSDSATACIEANKEYNIEHRIVLPSGEVKWVSEKGNVVGDKNRKPKRMLGIVQEITDRKYAEEKLLESKTRYENFISHASEGIYRIDITPPVPINLPRELLIKKINERAYITEVNEALVKMYGLTVDDMIGQLATSVAPNYGERASFVLDKENYKVDNQETEDIDKDGNKVFLLESYHGVVVEGKLERIWGVQRNITDRKEIEEKLELTINLSLDLICIGDYNGNLVMTNPAFEKILGYTKEELLSTTYLHFVHPDDIEKSNDASNSSVYMGYPMSNFENRWKCKDGSYRWISWNAVSIPERKEVYAIGHDITERKNSEKELRESESRFRTIIKESPISIQVLDKEGKTINVNSAFEELWALKLGDLKNYNILQDKQLTEKGIMPFIKRAYKGEVCNMPAREYDVSRLFGKNVKRWVDSIVYPLKNSEGNTENVILMHMDITERKKAEQELLIRDAAINASANAIAMADLENNIFYANKSYIQMFGYKEESEILKAPITKFMQNKEDVKILKKELIETGTSKGETIGLKKDGTKINIYHIANMVLDNEGNPFAIVASLLDITENKKTEQKLIESESRFKDLANLLPQPVWETNINGNFTYTNEAGSEKMGYSQEDIKNGVNMLELIAPQDRPKAVANIEKTLKGIAFDDHEYLCMRKDGTTFPGLVYSTPLLKDGKPNGIRGITLDVTQLKDANEFNKLIINNSPIGILIFEESGQCISCNEEAASAVGATVDKMLKLNFHELESWKKFGLYELALDALKTGQRNHKTFDVVTTFGKKLWIECHHTRFYRNNKKHLLQITKDVTAETIAQREREQFFIASQSLLCTANLEGYFLDLNPAWEEVLGFTLDELKSKKFIEFVHPDDIESTMKEMKKLENGLATDNFTNRFKCKNGEYKYFIWNSVCHDNIIYATANDTTKLEKYKEELEIYSRELKRSNEELEQFAYVASHDLQEPLRKIKSFSQMLAKKIDQHLDDKTNGYLNSIQGAVTRMQTLIDDLLSYSRISNRGLELAPTSLDKVLSEVRQLLELKLEKTKTSLIKKKLPIVSADEGQMIQLFQNLLSNAIKFNDKDKPEIEVGISKQTSDYVTVYVKDNGIGIDKEYTEKTFAIFQRLHTRDKYEGTGIGLAICKKIVERHNGKIWFRSIPLKETVFYIQLPKN